MKTYKYSTKDTWILRTKSRMYKNKDLRKNMHREEISHELPIKNYGIIYESIIFWWTTFSVNFYCDSISNYLFIIYKFNKQIQTFNMS